MQQDYLIKEYDYCSAPGRECKVNVNQYICFTGRVLNYRESPKAVAINEADSFYMKHMLSDQPKDIHC